IFFFSSRRRHTRFSRDWSSDVCSSDLPEILPHLGVRVVELRERAQAPPALVVGLLGPGYRKAVKVVPVLVRRGFPLLHHVGEGRSEERRVGKEGRSRWTPYAEKDKTKR